MEQLLIEDTIIEKRGNKVVVVLIAHELMSTAVINALRDLRGADCNIAVVTANLGQEAKSLEEGFKALEGVHLMNTHSTYLSSRLMGEIALISHDINMATISPTTSREVKPRLAPIRQFNNTSTRFNQKRMLRNHRR